MTLPLAGTTTERVCVRVYICTRARRATSDVRAFFSAHTAPPRRPGKAEAEALHRQELQAALDAQLDEYITSGAYAR